MNFFKKAFLKLSSSKTIQSKSKLISKEYYELYLVEKNEYTLSNLKDKTINAIIGLTKSKKVEDIQYYPIRTTFFYNNKFEYKFYSKSIYYNFRNYNEILSNNYYLIKLVNKDIQIMQSDIYFQFFPKNNIYCLNYLSYKIYDEYLIKNIAKGLKYLHDNSLTINKLTIENIKITFDGFIKLGELQTIEKSTRLKIENDYILFNKLCIEILGESKNIYKIEDFLNSSDNLLELIEEELKKSEYLSFSIKLKILNTLDLNLLNEQLKNKLIILFLMDLIKNESNILIKPNNTELSNEMIKYNLKNKQITEQMNYKKVLLYSILEMESNNLSDYLEMLFNLKEIELILILFNETNYYFKDKNINLINKFKINSLELLNENHPYLKETGYIKYSLIDFSNTNLIDILFNYLNNKKLKKDCFNFLIKIFLFLNNDIKKYFLNKLNNKELTIKILIKYLFIIINDLCPYGYMEIINKDLTEKDIKNLKKFNNLEFCNNIMFINDNNNCRKEFIQLIIPLLNDSKYFYRSIFLINFSYKYFPDNVLILDILPFLCKNLITKSKVLFEIITKILNFLNSEKIIDLSTIATTFNNKRIEIKDNNNTEILSIKKGMLDDESSITLEKAEKAIESKNNNNSQYNNKYNKEKKIEKVFLDEDSDDINW